MLLVSIASGVEKQTISRFLRISFTTVAVANFATKVVAAKYVVTPLMFQVSLAQDFLACVATIVGVNYVYYCLRRHRTNLRKAAAQISR